MTITAEYNQLNDQNLKNLNKRQAEAFAVDSDN